MRATILNSGLLVVSSSAVAEGGDRQQPQLLL